ncbi:hypothetical protein QTP70_007139 [Hemibagrus guttatus]|uniref:Tc1-like transposase DDE domain-containing protein n=1 Tax=Hemibagrus guttatus TaxID=175788 RepID=A0AAE0VC24_9TELE|nr:hypothetical protein QTP70_007139 [Hemibagrus guttatus]KAK3574254.1 hypothetical protein QTP86_004409 [Hemibagrus guttatus]
MVQEWFDEHNNGFEVMTWSPFFPDLNPIKHLWDVLDKLRSMEAPPRNLRDFKDLLLTFALLSEAPAEKPERALVIGDSILRHVKLARPLGAPAAQARCIPEARVPDIADKALIAEDFNIHFDKSEDPLRAAVVSILDSITTWMYVTPTGAVSSTTQVGCKLEEKERFWSELDEVMESIPTGERVVIGVDFNGHVGEGNRGDE